MVESVASEAAPPSRDRPVNNELVEKFQNELPQKFKKAVKVKSSEKDAVTKDLANGNFCFYENGKWGVKNAEGKILLKPTFEHNIVEENQAGVIAYQNGKCNYYLDGKPQFKNEYYFI